ncbi:type II secretion system protein, partial [Candidatus Daviesbacteria bacterium]|nr:type II secretion system protein [Candidatus Daviesbacteria bacterium]
MKKLLPKTLNNPSGFTLIELLVVIAIIAVLAITGFAAFRGFTGRGNDARRSSDLKAIGDALEANRGAAAYVVLASEQFASGAIPTDPDAARAARYCVT